MSGIKLRVHSIDLHSGSVFKVMEEDVKSTDTLDSALLMVLSAVNQSVDE